MIDESHSGSSCAVSHHCSPGLLLPAWRPPIDEVGAGVKTYRAIAYLLSLAYVLFGVNIITDRMVSCIEVVISQRRSVTVTLKNGENHTVQVPIWHSIVGTLTVHVIGASAAEIFLPIIEVAKHGFVASELGSAIIFGSGAYHLFVLIGLCLFSVKETTGKPIRDLRVFFVTTGFAIFAYVWMFILVDVSTPGKITLWEALVTVAFFPLLVFTAWFVERRLYRIKCKFPRRNGFVFPIPFIGNASGRAPLDELPDDVMAEIERKRRLGDLVRNLRLLNPGKSQVELEGMAQMQLLQSLPKTAAYYRMQAGKTISGGGDVISKDKILKRLKNENEIQRKHERVHTLNPNAQRLGFDQAHVAVMENCGSVIAITSRSGPGVDDTSLLVDYETVDETAKAGDDYEAEKSTLEFPPGTSTAIISVKVIDDDECEENKTFKVVLSNPRLVFAKPESGAVKVKVDGVVFTQQEICITILDDDHCGIFQFDAAVASFADSVKTAKVRVDRSSGARGEIMLPFKIVDNTAKQGRDFNLISDPELYFDTDLPEAFIEFEILESQRESKISNFFIELGKPDILSNPPVNEIGNPVLGAMTQIEIQICEDQALADIVDRLLQHGDIADLILQTTWAEQLREAVEFQPPGSGGHHGRGKAGRQKKTACATCRNNFHLKQIEYYILYGLSVPWRLIAAIIPPSHFLHGWVAYVCLLILMAFLSAIIGDLATAFGCTVGLKDTVTAITLIAFGMGLPDTLASRHAAMHEHSADAAIGGITGTNAVNVFLGIGMSWLAGAVYHSKKGTNFKIVSKNMGFIVAVYSVLATGAIITLMLRRLPPIRGELGGPRSIKFISAALFLFFWVTFVLLLALESYCIIPGF